MLACPQVGNHVIRKGTWIHINIYGKLVPLLRSTAQHNAYVSMACVSAGMVKHGHNALSSPTMSNNFLTLVALSPWLAHTATLVWPPLPTGMHHDERYFKDPHAFKPERWVDDVEAVLEPAAWMPFGAGPRRCPGERLAGEPTVSVYFTYTVAGIGLLSTTV